MSSMTEVQEIAYLASFANMTAYAYRGDNLLYSMQSKTTNVNFGDVIFGTWSSINHFATGLVRVFDHYDVSHKLFQLFSIFLQIIRANYDANKKVCN